MVLEIEEKVIEAKKASIILASVSTDTKNEALEAMAQALDDNRDKILEANQKDIEAAEKLKRKGELSQALVDRLKVSDSKISGMIDGIRDVIHLEDPVGKTIDALELDQGLELYQVSCPIGLIGVIFEARPDVVPQVMSLCLKSGNATIFKGGSEALNSNRTIFDLLNEAAESVKGMPSGAFQLLKQGRGQRHSQHGRIHRSRSSQEAPMHLSNTCRDNTKIPVLGHADGICQHMWTMKLDFQKHTMSALTQRSSTPQSVTQWRHCLSTKT
ncbi:MAG: hypothetical protein R2741_15220 [Methanolobus sp.]